MVIYESMAATGQMALSCGTKETITGWFVVPCSECLTLPVMLRASSNVSRENMFTISICPCARDLLHKFSCTGACAHGHTFWHKYIG